MSKLLIFTSRIHDEWEKYWGSPGNNGIVFNGRESENSKNYQDGTTWDLKKIERLLDVPNTYILLHQDMSSSFKTKEMKLEDKVIPYTVVYYSTTNAELKHSLWSFEMSREWECPQETPLLPMDKLCWALRQSQRDEAIIDKACDDIIEFYKRKIILTTKLETSLTFLHECLTCKPATLPRIVDKHYYFKVNNKEVSLKDLFDNWMGPKDNDGLANLRDGLFAWALVK